jgi:hypothetical protein
MSHNILFRKDNENLFLKLWTKMIKNASYRYLPLSLEAYILISKSKNLLYKDKSFIFILNNKPVAGVFLPIEKNQNYFSVSISNDFINAPLISNQNIEEEVYSAIDDICYKNNVSKIMFLIDPLEKYKYNILQKYNYLDASILSYIINLEYDDLFKICRRNHKRNINKILKNKDFSIFYIDKNNSNYKIHEEYRILHHKCSGAVTRPKKTFDLQFDKLKDGNAVLVGLKYKNKNIAFTYFEFNSDKSISTSAADNPDYNKLPLYHILMFSGMKYLKKAGIKYLDTGQPSSPSSQFFYYMDTKQFNISFFKRGFKGDFKNRFRGVKYFSEEALKKDMSNFIEKYKI